MSGSGVVGSSRFMSGVLGRRWFRSVAMGAALTLAAGVLVTLDPVAGVADAATPKTETQAVKTEQGELVAPDEASARLTASTRGKRVEVDALRTEDSQTFVNPDGTMTLEASSGPVRVRRGDHWVPVDTSLRTEDGVVRPKAAVPDLEFSGGGTGPFARMERGGKIFEMSWPGTLPTPTLEGSTATYPDVVPGGDLVVTALPQGFSESVVLRERSTEPVEIRLPLGMTDLDLQLGSKGQFSLVDGKGKRVAEAPPPRGRVRSSV